MNEFCKFIAICHFRRGLTIGFTGSGDEIVAATSVEGAGLDVVH
jgi:hypothetical protein